MDPNTEGVAPSDSPTDPEPESPEVPAAAVSAVDPEQIIDDRPLKNVIAEIERKAAAREMALKAELLAAIQAGQRQTPPASQGREYTEQELAQLATAGDANAHAQLTERQVTRHVTQQVQAVQQQQAEMAQLNALFGRYQCLRDASHPLTSYATQVKTVLLQQGHPNSVATVIESIKTAIADNPDLAAQSISRPAVPSAPRPNVPTSSSAAPAPRRAAPAAPKAPVVSDKEWEVAKRMGFKTKEDVVKAKEQFEKRLERGQSRLGAVGLHVREDV